MSQKSYTSASKSSITPEEVKKFLGSTESIHVEVILMESSFKVKS